VANNKQIASDVLNAVGGSANVTFVTHCMTRLRFNLKDRSVVDLNRVKTINGVIGVQESGGQLQVIIGQNVLKVYDELCTLGGFAKQDAIDENLDGERRKLTPAVIGNNILNYLSGSMTPLIPLLMCAGLFKTIGVVVGPTMLNLMSDESDLVVLMNMLYNAAFYFLPIYLGFNAAKCLGVTPILGAFMGGIMIEPSFVSMATEGASFSVYGIPATPGLYAQTAIPILLSVFTMRFIEGGLKKIMPDALSTVFTPFLTMAIAVPLALCLLGPLGYWAGAGLSVVFGFLGSEGGILTVIGAALLAAVWLPLVITGMHVAIIMIAIANFAAVGYDNFVLANTTIGLWAAYGVQLATVLKLKDPHEKEMTLGYIVAQWIGGVGEPFIYGMMFRYRRLIVCSILGAAVAGLVGGALGLTCYIPGGAANVLNILIYVGGGTANLVNACIAAAAGFVAGFIVTWFFGFTKDEIGHGPVGERP